MRTHTRLKTHPSKSKVVAVDRDNGRLNGVSVMESGPAIGHGFELDEQSLDEVVRLGNEAKGGIKTRFTHPDMCHEGLGNELGRSVNFRKSEDGGRVLADLVLLQAAGKSPSGDLRGWVLDMAEEDPGLIGMSVVMSGDLEEQRDDDGEPRVDGDGHTLPALYRPKVLHANDLVDEPAANRRGLFGNAELSAAAVVALDNAIASVFPLVDWQPWISTNTNGDDLGATFTHNLPELFEHDLARLALSMGVVGADTFTAGEHTVALTDHPPLELMAGFINHYLDRRGILHTQVDPPMLRRLLTSQPQGTKTMPKEPKATGDEPTAQTPPALSQLDLDKAAAAAVASENQRVSEIQALGRLFPEYEHELRETVDDCLGDTTCTVDNARKRVLKAYESALKDSPIMHEPIKVGESAQTKFVAAASDALLLRGGHLPRDQRDEVRATGLANLGPKQLARKCLKLSGVRNADSMGDLQLFEAAMGGGGTIAIADDMDPKTLLVVGHATGDFPLILANAGNKSMISGYELAQVTWPIWCKKGTLSDFKTAKRLRLSESPILVDRPEGLPAEMGTFNEQGEDITLVNKAKGFSYTRQMFVNDDLSAFLTLGARFGNGAAQTVEFLVYQSLVSNTNAGPTMSDSVALFNAAHNNLNSGGSSVPDQAAIEAMVQAMMIQGGTGEDGALLTVGAPPRFFLAQPLTAMAISAIIDAPFRGTASLEQPQDVDIAAARAVKVPQLALQGDNVSWYGVADQNAAPSYEVAFLNGVETPRTKSIVGTTVDGTTIVVDMDFGIFPTGGHQGINRNAGV